MITVPVQKLAFTKAPVSEVICATVFNVAVLEERGVIHEILSTLSKEYPISDNVPAVPEEELMGFTLQNSMDYNKTGFVLYRFISEDQRWLVQFQQNYFSLHWIREDNEVVGEYPGFSEIYNRFETLFNLVQTKVHETSPHINFQSLIKSYTLHYQDRIYWRQYTDVSPDELSNFKFPIFHTPSGEARPNNVFSKYSVPCSEINGYSIININTGTAPNQEQMFIVENKMKGKLHNADMQSWFRIAHELQVDFFQNFFTQEVLDSWK